MLDAVGGLGRAAGAGPVPRNVRRVQHVTFAPYVIMCASKFPSVCKFLAGSFSAVSKPILQVTPSISFPKWLNMSFAVFFIIFQDLQDTHNFAPLQTEQFRKQSV